MSNIICKAYSFGGHRDEPDFWMVRHDEGPNFRIFDREGITMYRWGSTTSDMVTVNAHNGDRIVRTVGVEVFDAEDNRIGTLALHSGDIAGWLGESTDGDPIIIASTENPGGDEWHAYALASLAVALADQGKYPRQETENDV